MSAFCRIDDIPDGGAIEVRAEGQPPTMIVLIRRQARVFAYFNICPHAGRSMNWAPDRFIFTPAGQLVCAVHGATFEVDSGECVLGPCLGMHLKRFEIEVRDGQIWPVP